MLVRDALLSASLARLDDGTAVTMDPGFSGLPDMAHGGTVLALFDGAAQLDGPRRVRGHYRRKVPVATALTLRRVEVEGCARFDLLDAAGTALVDGEVTPAPGAPVTPAEARAGQALPVSSSCFVCGVANEIGLRATFAADDAAIAATWRAPERFRAPDGTLAPVALTALLDEGAFWLGALATGEGGMTTELDVTLHRPVAFGTPVTIVGDRRSATPRAADPRYLDTEVAALDADGGTVATARIAFVTVRGTTRKLAAWLARTNAPGTVRRVFPSYPA